MVTGGVGERRIRLDRTQEQATTMSVHQAFYIRAFANLSGSLLLAGILVGLVAGSAALWLVGRGLNLARREAALWAPKLLAYLLTFQARVDQEADERIFRPHVMGLSMVRGVRAGVAAFLRGSPSVG